MSECSHHTASFLTVTPFAKKIIITEDVFEDGSHCKVQISLLVMSVLQDKQWAGPITCLNNDFPGNKTRQLMRFLFLMLF